MGGDWTQTLNFALAVLNFIVATVLVLRGYRVSREIGAATITARAQSEYRQALLDAHDDVKTAEQADRFYDRFWSGQVLQFEQWRRRLIPDAIYADWLLKRRAQFIKNDVMAGVSFHDAWATRLEDRYSRTRFGASNVK